MTWIAREQEGIAAVGADTGRTAADHRPAYRSHPFSNGNRASQNAASLGSASTLRTIDVMPGASR